MIKAYCFNNKQSGADILQPDFFTPKTQLRVDAELPGVEFPIKINVSASCKNIAVFDKSYVIEEREEEKEFIFEIHASDKDIMLKDLVIALENGPDYYTPNTKLLELLRQLCHNVTRGVILWQGTKNTQSNLLAMNVMSSIE